MPRSHDEDLYPGEATSGWSIPEQAIIFDTYHRTARELQVKYAGQIELLVGMEIDWIRPASREWVDGLIARWGMDMFVGSVHHVHGVPIDYDVETYARALGICEARARERGCGEEEVLFEDYFDAQYEMLRGLEPPVVGHFDLIRLLSGCKDESLKRFDGVWSRIERNLAFTKSYGGCVELNSAGLRKGLKEPYPKMEVCKHFNELGGRFVLSDDSHGIGHVGSCYEGTLKHAKDAEIKDLAVFSRGNGMHTLDRRFPGVGVNMLSIEAIEKLEFWSRKGFDV